MLAVAMEALADRITSELGALIGQPIGDCWRAANMQIFEFGPRHQRLNRKRQMVEVSDIKLHIECRWRFVDDRSILFGRDDLLYPADEQIPWDQFDWDKDKSVLDVTQRAWFEKRRPSLPVVDDVLGDRYGGFRLSLAGGFALECFPCDSRRGQYSELWRLFGHRPDGSHFVVTGDGIGSDGGRAR
jgi:hypothetical protein